MSRDPIRPGDKEKRAHLLAALALALGAGLAAPGDAASANDAHQVAATAQPNATLAAQFDAAFVPGKLSHRLDPPSIGEDPA